MRSSAFLGLRGAQRAEGILYHHERVVVVQRAIVLHRKARRIDAVVGGILLQDRVRRVERVTKRAARLLDLPGHLVAEVDHRTAVGDVVF